MAQNVSVFDNEPQIVVTGELRQKPKKSDVIVFTIGLSMFELVCIVTVPDEGTTSAPVYVKFKVRR